MMFIEWFLSISNIFHNLLCSSGSPRPSLPSIPDDIWFDIISRLPADCVRECRKVCRRWRTLTSSRSFAEMQLRRATSVIYVQCDHCLRTENEARSHLFVFNEKKRGRKQVSLKPVSITSIRDPCWIRCSFGGLFVLRDHANYDHCIVCDARGESISIKYPTHRGAVCGLYFLPLASDYKILYRCYTQYYYIYDSKTMVWRRLKSRYFAPSSIGSATFLNMAMHLIVSVKAVESVGGPNINLCECAVMVFQMDTEEFFCMPHPEFKCPAYLHDKMELFVKGGLLCLCDVRYANAEEDGGIDIWVLEDYASRWWVKRHRISPGMFQMPYSVSMFTKLIRVSFVEVNEDEVLMSCSFQGLFLVNLTQGIAKKVKDPCHVR